MVTDPYRQPGARIPLPTPRRRWGAAAFVAGGTVVALLILWTGVALSGWLASSRHDRANRLETHIGHLIVVTGNLVDVLDPSLPFYTGIYEIRIPRTNGLADQVRQVKGPDDLAYSASEATFPSTYDFLVDERDGKTLASGPIGSLTVPDDSTVGRLRTYGFMFSVVRSVLLIASIATLTTAVWTIARLLRPNHGPVR
jgi:hypothetical protein